MEDKDIIFKLSQVNQLVNILAEAKFKEVFQAVGLIQQIVAAQNPQPPASELKAVAE